MALVPAPLSLTFSASTDAHSSGDVVAAAQALPDWSREKGQGVLLQSVVLFDASDTGAALDLVFMNTPLSIGAESAAIGPSDADAAAAVIGVVSIAASDYADLTNSQVATKGSVGLILHPLENSTTIYVALVARGSITPGSIGDIKVQFGRVYVS